MLMKQFSCEGQTDETGEEVMAGRVLVSGAGARPGPGPGSHAAVTQLLTDSPVYTQCNAACIHSLNYEKAEKIFLFQMQSCNSYLTQQSGW